MAKDGGTIVTSDTFVLFKGFGSGLREAAIVVLVAIPKPAARTVIVAVIVASVLRVPVPKQKTRRGEETSAIVAAASMS
jgi:hypothetical protein